MMFIKSIKLTKFIKRFCAEHILSYVLGYFGGGLK